MSLLPRADFYRRSGWSVSRGAPVTLDGRRVLVPARSQYSLLLTGRFGGEPCGSKSRRAGDGVAADGAPAEVGGNAGAGVEVGEGERAAGAEEQARGVGAVAVPVADDGQPVAAAPAELGIDAAAGVVVGQGPDVGGGVVEAGAVDAIAVPVADDGDLGAAAPAELG